MADDRVGRKRRKGRKAESGERTGDGEMREEARIGQGGIVLSRLE